MKKNTNLVGVYGKTCLEICLVPLSLEPEFSSGRVRFFVFLCDGQIYTKLYDFPPPKICFFVLRAYVANSLLKQVLCNMAHSIK